MTGRERLTLLRLFASTFCELNAVLMLMPLMTLRLAARGEAAWIIGLFGAALYGAIFVVTPFAAACTRRLGLRATYALSGIAPLFAVATVAVTPRLDAWFLAAAVLGCFGGLRWVTAEAFVAEAAPAERRGVVIGAYEAMVGACFIIGPLLVSVSGIEGPRPLILSGALLAVGVLCLFGLPALPTYGAERSHVAFLRLARERPVLLAAALIGGMLESASATFLPVAGFSAGFPAAAAAGLAAALGTGGFLCQLPIGYLADRRPLGALLRACLWSILLGALLAWPAARWPELLWPVAVLWGAATGSLYTLAMIVIGHAYRGVALVGATSALVFAYAAGGALGPALVGLAVQLAPDFGFAALFCAVAVAGLALIPGTALAAPARRVGPADCRADPDDPD